MPTAGKSCTADVTDLAGILADLGPQDDGWCEAVRFDVGVMRAMVDCRKDVATAETASTYAAVPTLRAFMSSRLQSLFKTEQGK